MKILVVLPLFPFSQDTPDVAYYNICLPLIELGHKVIIFDTKESQISFEQCLEVSGTPDLVFSALTGEGKEPLEEIGDLTKRGVITVHLFSDDSWRFDKWSSKICRQFSYCLTSQPSAVNKYKQIGYRNIIGIPWFCNEHLYSDISLAKKYNIVTTSRYLNTQRQSYQSSLSRLDPVKNRFGLGVPTETMIIWMKKSKITLNLSGDSGGTTQIKLRMFEAPACNSLLLSEYTEDIEQFWDINKEIICFDSLPEFESKALWLLANDGKRAKVSQYAHERFLKQYTSKIVLKQILEKLK